MGHKLFHTKTVRHGSKTSVELYRNKQPIVIHKRSNGSYHESAPGIGYLSEARTKSSFGSQHARAEPTYKKSGGDLQDETTDYTTKFLRNMEAKRRREPEPETGPPTFQDRKTYMKDMAEALSAFKKRKA